MSRIRGKSPKCKSENSLRLQDERQGEGGGEEGPKGGVSPGVHPQVDEVEDGQVEQDRGPRRTAAVSSGERNYFSVPSPQTKGWPQV